MNKFRSIIAALGIFTSVAVPIAIIDLTGCATAPAAGQEQFVITSENALKLAFESVNAFLTWELQNRGTVVCPIGATAAADELRRNFKPAYDGAWETLRVYKSSRTPEHKAAFSTWLATINAAALNALRAMPSDMANKTMNSVTLK